MNSSVNEWNSVATGQRLDLVGLHAAAIRANGLKFMVSMHHEFNFGGYYSGVPAQPTTTLKKLYGQLDVTTEWQLWYDKLRRRQAVGLGRWPPGSWQTWSGATGFPGIHRPASRQLRGCPRTGGRVDPDKKAIPHASGISQARASTPARR